MYRDELRCHRTERYLVKQGMFLGAGTEGVMFDVCVCVCVLGGGGCFQRREGCAVIVIGE